MLPNMPNLFDEFFSFLRARNFRQPTMSPDMPNWFDDFFLWRTQFSSKYDVSLYALTDLTSFLFLARAHKCASDNCLSNSLLCGLV